MPLDDDSLKDDFQRLVNAFLRIDPKQREEILGILEDLGRDLEALFRKYAPFMDWGVCYRTILQRLRRGSARGATRGRRPRRTRR